ncbi:MAG: kynureninase [Bacteroidetes bacterium]|jgi:kynureninase|nr:kynureninase [Bacteroidota bacterium]
MNELKTKAKELDQKDSLRHFREEFYIPKMPGGRNRVYLCGNSLGLQPKRTSAYVNQELEDWKFLGVDGHFEARKPWMPYHEFLTDQMAEVVGGHSNEVVVMNSLTVNLHLLMVSFYRPKSDRYKIIIEKNAFPSDQYAIKSQLDFHGFDARKGLLEMPTSKGFEYTKTEDILAFVENHGDETALILLSGVNYYSGQAFPLKEIVEAGHNKGCIVGFDLAHAAGNIDCQLHDSGADFATWCTYKYLNSGPGGMSGVFVHDRHAQNFDLPRFAGWWGHDKRSRFKMPATFLPEKGAEGWQLSNPPILAMAALRASLSIFDEAGMNKLREKSKKLTSFFERCIHSISSDRIEIITPREDQHRGCQLSLRVKNADRSIFKALTHMGVVSDWREPDVIRIAPVPLYNTFEEGAIFAEKLEKAVLVNN